MACITVDVDLDDFDDDDIIEEYNARGLGGQPTESEDIERLMLIHHQLRMGNETRAHDLMYDYIRDRLGVAV